MLQCQGLAIVHWHDLPAHLSGTDPSLMLLVTPAIFMKLQVKPVPRERTIIKQTDLHVQRSANISNLVF